MDRLDALKQMAAADPNNTFVRYGLAMEFAREEKVDEAMREFTAVLAVNPDYCAAYFHGGQTLEKAGRIEEARDFYRKGIEAAARTGDLHTRSELQGALDLLGE